jgi:hypothetical protein
MQEIVGAGSFSFSAVAETSRRKISGGLDN